MNSGLRSCFCCWRLTMCRCLSARTSASISQNQWCGLRRYSSQAPSAPTPQTTWPPTSTARCCMTRLTTARNSGSGITLAIAVPTPTGPPARRSRWPRSRRASTKTSRLCLGRCATPRATTASLGESRRWGRCSSREVVRTTPSTYHTRLSAVLR